MAAHKPSKPQKPHATRPGSPLAARRSRPAYLLEELEPRLLFSADLAPLAMLAGGLAPETSSGTPAAPANAQPQASIQQLLAQPGTPAQTERHELIFVDGGIDHLDQLLADLKARQPAARWVVIDPTADGLAVITETLKSAQGLDAVHIVSHGNEQGLRLGSTFLDEATLQRRAQEVASWSKAFHAGADLMLYGCDLAAGSEGRALADGLSLLTGTDVAASNDLTGATALGGDWTLEYQHGLIQAQSALTGQGQWQGTLGIATTGSETLAHAATGATSETTTTNRQIAADSSGNFVAVWQNGSAIEGQRFTAAGATNGAKFTISSSGTPANAQVAMNASGAFVVVWNDASNNLYFQRYNSAGAAQGSATTVVATAQTSGNGAFFTPPYWVQTTSGTHATVGINTAGDFVVAYRLNTTRIDYWDPTHTSPTGTTAVSDAIDFKAYTSTGAAQGTNGSGTVSTAVLTGAAPAIAMNASGDFVVSWSDSSNNVSARLYNAARAAVTAGGDVTGGTGGSQSSVGISDSGSYVVAYNKAGLINYRLYSATGTATSVVTQANLNPPGTTPTASRANPSVAMTTTGEFAIAWENTGQDGSGTGVYLRQFTSAGVAVRSDIQVATSTSGAQQNVSLAYKGTQVTALWNGNGTQTSQVDAQGVFFQRYVVTTGTSAPGNITTTAAALAYTENQTATAVDNALVLAPDPDGDYYQSATVGISTGFVTGQDVLAFTNANGITGTFNAATGVMTLTGNASIASYQAALRSITYVNTSENPNTATRIVSFGVNDGSANSNTATRNVTVTAVNDAPLVTTTTAALAYTENQAATAIDPGLSVSDVDNTNLTGATVSISANFASGQDVLAFVNQNGITGSYNATTGVLTLSGSATLANYQTALRSITYANTSDNPSTTTRTVTFTVNDGGATNNTGSASRNVGITAVNDAPVVTTTAAALAYTENQAATAIDTGLSLSDVDSANLTGATITIGTGFATGQDVLAFANQNGITGSYNATTGVLTLSGTTTKANYQTALRSVTYVNTSENPSTATRTVAFTVNDGSASNNTGTASRTITVAAVNDAPVVTTTATALNYTENQAPTAIDTGLSLSDVDNTNLTGATVSIGTGFATGQDVLAFTNQGGITGNYNATTGVLTLSGTATVATYQTALRSVTYVNTSENPSTATRTVTFSVNDGSASNNTGAGTRNITVTAVNDAPVVTATATALAYTENQAATAVDNALTVSDTDSSNLTGATVSIGANFTSGQDVLAFTNQNGITGTFNSSTGVLTLSGSATVANYQAALRAITYTNTSENPSTLARTVTFTVNDGSASNNTGSATRTINVTSVNDAPVLTTTGTPLAYTENQAATAVDSGLSVSDVDSTTLLSATVSIGTGFASGQDVLAFANQNGITGSYNASTGVLSLSGAATLANYQTALRSVTYTNTSDNPSTATRTVSFSVNDGAASNNTASGTRNITVAAVNDAPTITSNGAGNTATASIAENTTAVTTVTATDLDNATLTYTIVNTGDGGQFTINSSTGALRFTAAPDFETPLDADHNNSYVVTVQASDGSLTDTQTITVNVTDVASTLIVDTTGDTNDTGLGTSFNAEALNASKGTDGKISLREAIIAANNTSGTDTIRFNLSGVTGLYGERTVSIATALPSITDAVVIDASTQSGFAGSPLVVLDGGNIAASGLTLTSTADGSTVRGLVIRHFGRDGIEIQFGSDNNTIVGNYIGSFNADGSDAGSTFANGDSGIQVSGANTRIGGSTAADRNVISGNTGRGIRVSTGADGSVITGNYIGVTASGSTAFTNKGQWGIQVEGSATNVTLGGSTSALRNVIGGHTNDGIWINTGGTVTVQGNFVGLGADGSTLVGNGGSGVYLASHNITIGGKGAGQGNTIAGNGGAGIAVVTGYINDLFYRNSIYSNTGLGIDLNNDGVTLNDVNDGDGGANYLNNYPVITSVVTTGGSTVISGSIDWHQGPDNVYIELYSSPSKDASGYGEGRTYLGSALVTTTSGTGDATFSLSVTGVAVGDWVTAVANVETSFIGASEFAKAVQAVAPANGPRGKVIWNNNDEFFQHYADWSNAGFSDSGVNGLNFGDDITMMASAEAPSRSEMIFIGSSDVSGKVMAGVWNGSSWSSVLGIPVANPGAQASQFDSFALAYDQVSGNAMLVWDNGSNTGNGVSYATWNGSTWSSIQTLSLPITGEPVHMQLAASPNSDTMVLAISTNAASNNQVALVWDGSAWGHAQTLGSNTHQAHFEMSVAFEQQSGRAMVLYDNSAGDSPDVQFQIWDGSSWSGEQSVSAPAGINTAYELRSTVIASDLKSNRLALAAKDDHDQVWMSVWDGSAWGSEVIATTSGVTLPDDHPTMALAFESQSGELLAAYGKATGPNVYFRNWDATNGWSAEGTGPTLGGTDVPNIVKLYADPYSNGVMMGVQDNALDLSFTLWDGSAWGTPTVLDSNTGEYYRENFSFVWYVNVPTINNLDGDALDYYNGDGTVLIDQGASAAVVAGDPAGYTGGKLTVSFKAGGINTEDLLGIQNQGVGAGQIGLSGSNVSFGGTVIGSYSGGSNGSPLVVSFNASATDAAVSALASHITYQNTNAGVLTTGARTVRFVVTNASNKDSAPVDTNLSVKLTNLAPVLSTSGGALSYTENQAATAIDPALTLSDADNANLAGATISIGTGFAAGQDLLSFANQNGITGSYNASTGVLTLSGTASVASYQTALRSVSYSNSSDNPSTATRTLTFSANDGSASNNIGLATRDVTVTAVSDAPVPSVPGAQTTLEDTNIVFSAANGNAITLSDVDANGGVSEVTLSVTRGTLTLSSTTGLSFTAGNGTANSTMTFQGTLADLNNALNGLSYQPNSNDNGSVTLTVSSKDSTLVQLDADPTLVGHYTFNTPASLGDDTSPGTTQNATANGAATSIIDATRGPVLSLSGTGSLQAPGMFGQPSDVTLAAWVKHDASQTTACDVISLGDHAALRIFNGATPHVEGFFYNGSGWTYASFDVNISDGNWHHLAYTMDDTHDQASLYVDGALVSLVSTVDAIQYVLGTDTFIGNHGDGQPYPYAGLIDDARIYTRALSASDIASLAKDLPLTPVSTVALNITPVNDAPTLTGSAAALAYTEGQTLAVDPGLNLADIDSNTMSAATISISGHFVSGDDMLGFANQNGISGSYNASTGVLKLSGQASVADYQAALRSVTYTNTSAHPDTATRTLSFVVDDGSAANATASATRSINLTAVNNAPTIATTGGDMAYTENAGGQAIDPGISLADVDSSMLSGATISIGAGFVAGEDSLGFVTQAGISGSYNASTGVLTLSGAASVADYENALSSVSYTNSAEQPSTGTRTITFSVNDGSGSNATASATRGVAITAINDAPVVSASSNPMAYTEQQGSALIDSALSLSDVDSATLVGATVSISSGLHSGEDVLEFLNQSGISGNFDAASGVLTLSGSATVAQYEAALRSVTYRNDADNPNTTLRTLTFTVDDGSSVNHVGSAGRNLQITAVNDAPVLSLQASPLSHTENNAATPVDATLALNDVDSTSLMGATVRITANLNSAQDQLLFTNLGSITGSYDSATGTLTATGAGTLADYQAFLRSVSFFNSSDNPSTATRTVSFIVDDGSGSNATGSASRDVQVVAVNDAPALTAAASSLAYTEGDGAVVIDPSLTVSDVDSATLVGATVQLSDNYVPGQGLLGFATLGGITGSFDSASGTLTLSGNGTAAQYQAALRSVTYTNTSDNPSTNTRTVSFTVSDGSTLNPQGSATRHIDLTAVNDAPTLALDPIPLVYTENDGARPVDASLSLSDVDSATLVGATVQITAGLASGEDLLSFVNQSGISGSYDPATGLLSLNGTATVAQYEAALRSVTYVNVSEAPSTNTRTLSMTVDDGSGTSNVASASRSVQVVSVNDTPVVTLDANPLAYTEGQGSTVVDANLSLSDLDGTTLVSATVQISSGFAGSQDVLGFVDQNGITGSYNASTGVLTFSGAGTLADYEASLRLVTYANTSSAPSGSTRSLTFSVSDGGSGQAMGSANRDIAVTTINDAPLLMTDPTPMAYVENQMATAIDGGLQLQDIDSPTLVGATVRIDNFVAEQDKLEFISQSGINGAFNPQTGVLTLSGSATSAQYQAALRSVSYVNTSDNPDTTQRQVLITVDDGNAFNHIAIASSTIDVSAVNDAPQISDLTEVPVTQGSTASLAGHWLALDPDSAPQALTYTLATLPQQGQLYRGNVPLGTGSQFTQAELDAGLIVYRHTGVSLAADSLQLSAADAQGASLGSGPITVSLKVGAQAAIAGPSLTNASTSGLGNLPAAAPSVDRTEAASDKASSASQTSTKPITTAPTTAAAATQDENNSKPNAVIARNLKANLDMGYEAPNAGRYELTIHETARMVQTDFNLVLKLVQSAVNNALPQGLSVVPNLSLDGQHALINKLSWDIPSSEHRLPLIGQVSPQAIEASGIALTVGAVWWISRSATLLGSLLLSTPIWRSIDPLPVFATGDHEDDDPDTQTHEDAVAEQMFDEGGKAHAEDLVIG